MAPAPAWARTAVSAPARPLVGISSPRGRSTRPAGSCSAPAAQAPARLRMMAWAGGGRRASRIRLRRSSLVATVTSSTPMAPTDSRVLAWPAPGRMAPRPQAVPTGSQDTPEWPVLGRMAPTAPVRRRASWTRSRRSCPDSTEPGPRPLLVKV
ncbi:hypothetical protein ACQJBY_057599 [Aegilops geniculata]